MIEAIKAALQTGAEDITPKQLEELDVQIAEIFGFKASATTTNRTGKKTAVSWERNGESFFKIPIYRYDIAALLKEAKNQKLLISIQQFPWGVTACCFKHDMQQLSRSERADGNEALAVLETLLVAVIKDKKLDDI